MLGSHLRVAMPGGLAAGGTDRIEPKAGRLVLFPSWLLHQVRPYRGNADRGPRRRSAMGAGTPSSNSSAEGAGRK